MTYTAIKVIKNIWLIPNSAFDLKVDALFQKINLCKHGSELDLSDEELDLYRSINLHPRVIKLGSV